MVWLSLSSEDLGTENSVSRMRTIRIYSRQLTEEERTHNYRIDEERYHSGAMSLYESTATGRVNTFGLFIVVELRRREARRKQARGNGCLARCVEDGNLIYFRL